MRLIIIIDRPSWHFRQGHRPNTNLCYVQNVEVVFLFATGIDACVCPRVSVPLLGVQVRTRMCQCVCVLARALFGRAS